MDALDLYNKVKCRTNVFPPQTAQDGNEESSPSSRAGRRTHRQGEAQPSSAGGSPYLLPTSPSTEDDEEPTISLVCPICEDDYDLKDRIPAKLPCSHSFCIAHESELPLPRCPSCGVEYSPPLSQDDNIVAFVAAFASIFSSDDHHPTRAPALVTPPKTRPDHCSHLAPALVTPPKTPDRCCSPNDPSAAGGSAPPLLLDAAAKTKTKKPNKAQSGGGDGARAELCDLCATPTSEGVCPLGCIRNGPFVRSPPLLISSVVSTTPKKKSAPRGSGCGGCKSPFLKVCARNCDCCDCTLRCGVCRLQLTKLQCYRS